MNRRITTTATLLVGGLLMLSACGTQSTGGTTSADTSSDPVTIKTCGHEMTFDGPPKRVVTQTKTLAESLAALGLTDRIVGMGYDNLTPLDEYEEELDKIPSLGDGTLSREVVVDKDPDLFYSDMNYEGEMVEDYSPLDIPVIFATMYCSKYAPTYDNGDPNMIESRYHDISDLGDIFGIPEKADDLIASLKKKMASVRNAAKGQTSVKVAGIEFYSGLDGPLTVRPGQDLVNELFEVAGGTNVYGDIDGESGQESSVESLIERAPDVIVVGKVDNIGVDEVRDFLRNDDRFADIPAVKHDRFTYIHSEEIFAGIQFPNAAERFVKVFHSKS